MDSITLIIIFLLAVFFIFIFFLKNNKQSRDKKSYYLKRFIRNKEKSLFYISQVEAIIKENDALNKEAFPDKKITFSVYLETLKSKYDAEYSESTQQILKRNKLNFAQKQEYTRKLVEQSEDLYLMEIDLVTLSKFWGKVVC